jgi:hypothetical protein
MPTGFQRFRWVILAGAVALMPPLAVAQQPPSAPQAVQAAPVPEHDAGFFGNISRWWDRQVSAAQATWQGMGTQFRNLGHEASIAAQTGADGAKQAASTVAKLRNTRVAVGHEKCSLAPNGAPDCFKAAAALCKSQGFETGTSLDMTTAEECPAKVYIAGRNSGPECTSYTFVSRALCQ